MGECQPVSGKKLLRGTRSRATGTVALPILNGKATSPCCFHASEEHLRRLNLGGMDARTLDGAFCFVELLRLGRCPQPRSGRIGFQLRCLIRVQSLAAKLQSHLSALIYVISG